MNVRTSKSSRTSADLESRGGPSRAKLRSNYIYNLEYLDEHDVSKFNILLEPEGVESRKPVKLMAVLEHLPEIRKLRLITFF